jgi:hypothetical protein
MPYGKSNNDACTPLIWVIKHNQTPVFMRKTRGNTKNAYFAKKGVAGLRH